LRELIGWSEDADGHDRRFDRRDPIKGSVSTMAKTFTQPTVTLQDPNAQSAGGTPEDKARLVCVRSRKHARP